MSRPSSSLPESLQDHLDETASADERTALEQTWALLGRIAPGQTDAERREDAWASIQERIDADTADASDADLPRADAPSDRGPSRPSRPPSSRRTDAGSSRRVWLGAVAALVLVVAGAVLFWQQPVTVTAEAGAQETVTLPDGSTVELNSGTSVTYARGFDSFPLVDASQRVVRLRGEAYFDVTPSSRPFVVQTQNAQVDVLGTTFNVRSRTGSATEVTVESGRVRVQPLRLPDVSVVLNEPGQSSRIAGPDARPTEPTTVDVNRTLLWRQQGFAVNGESLAQVIREIEQRYGVVVRLDPDVEDEASLSLYYPQAPSVDVLLEDIAAARALTVVKTREGSYRLQRSDS